MKNRDRALTTLVTVTLITFWMQLEGDTRWPYRDVGGTPTTCSGHTGPDVVMGRRWTDAQCREVTERDLTKAALILIRYAPDADLTRNQFDALVVMIGNIGEYAFANSHLLYRLNEGDMEGVQTQMERWIWAGGKPVLVTRRAAEIARFRLPDQPLASIRVFA